MQVPPVTSSQFEDLYLDLIRLALSAASFVKESRPDMSVIHEHLYKSFKVLREMHLEE